VKNSQRLSVSLCLFAVLLSPAPARSAQPRLYRVPDTAGSQVSPAVLMSLGIEGDHDRVDGDRILSLEPQQLELLRDRGIPVRPLLPGSEESDFRLGRPPERDTFHTYDEIRAGLYNCAAAHPAIAQVQVLGHSLEGREIVALKISDAVQSDEDEPELALWGGVHGDEYAGGEMPYLYALYLCDGYGTDPAVTQMVDENEIWCIPMINPDGRAHARRTNMNGIDLNRDFGYEWNGEGSSPLPLSQVETRAVEEFCRSRPITLSLTFHCSGNIVFYPWGYFPQNVPDFEIVRSLAAGYASAAGYAFGNSWADYETHGELLDQSYGGRGAICYTVEISNQFSLLNDTFARNRAGMTWLIHQSAGGLIGTVRDAGGLPLDATVRLSGNPVLSYADAGGVIRRVVAPGTYDLGFWSDGYQAALVSGIVVTSSDAGNFAATLLPGDGEHACSIVSVNQRDPNNRHVQATYPQQAVGIPDGVPASLGTAGFTVLDLGAGHEALDGPGDDFIVTEALFAADPAPESYRVYVGDAFVQGTLVGAGVGTASFDLGAAGVTSARYVKILDQSGASPDLPYSGMDLDGITLLHGAAASVSASSDPAIRAAIRPNPAGSRAAVRFTLREPQSVLLELFDPGGRLVGRYGGRMAAGEREIGLDRPASGGGVYFYRMRVGSQEEAGRLVFVH
jgi:predicted deacylase